jgi:hypothetical protein
MIHKTLPLGMSLMFYYKPIQRYVENDIASIKGVIVRIGSITAKRLVLEVDYHTHVETPEIKLPMQAEKVARMTVTKDITIYILNVNKTGVKMNISTETNIFCEVS